MISSKAKHPNCMYKWMDWIVSPKVNAAGGGVVRRGAGADQGLRPDRRQVPLRRPTTRSTRPTPTGSRTGPRRPATAATTAAPPARTTRRGRRPGRRSRADRRPRRRPDPGRPAGTRPRCWRPASCTATPGPAGRAAGRADGSGSSSPTSARWRCMFVAAFWSTDSFTGALIKQRQLGQLPDPRRASRSTGRIALRTLGVAGDGDRGGRADRAADGVLHGEGRPAAGAPAAGRRDPHPAVGELPGQGVRVADHAQPGRPGGLGAGDRCTCPARATGWSR